MVKARKVKTYLSKQQENLVLDAIKKPFVSVSAVAKSTGVSTYHVERLIQMFDFEHNRQTPMSTLKGRSTKARLEGKDWTQGKSEGALYKQEVPDIFEEEPVAPAIPTPTMSTGRQTLGTNLEAARQFALDCQELWEQAQYRVKVLESFEGQDALRESNKELRARADRLEQQTRQAIMSPPQKSAEQLAHEMEAYRNANAGLMGDKGIS